MQTWTIWWWGLTCFSINFHESGSLVQQVIHHRIHIAWIQCRVLQFSWKPRLLPTVEHGWKHNVAGFRRRIGWISVIILSEAQSNALSRPAHYYKIWLSLPMHIRSYPGFTATLHLFYSDHQPVIKLLFHMLFSELFSLQVVSALIFVSLSVMLSEHKLYFN